MRGIASSPVFLQPYAQEPALNEANLSNLKAPLDIPVPDPVKDKEKEERKKQQEASWETWEEGPNLGENHQL